MEIDDALYSRMRYVLGDQAMHRMAKSSVFLSGLGGLGAEVAKNVVLAGVERLTLHDTRASTSEDLATQFFLRSGDVASQRNRAEASLERVAVLNPHVSVDTSTVDLDDAGFGLSFFDQYQVVVLIDAPLSVSIKVNEHCRARGIRFLKGTCVGACAGVFCDFGDEFEVYDTTGESEKTVILSSIQLSEQGVCDTLDHRLHGFEDGDVIELAEVIHDADADDAELVSMNGTRHTVQVVNPHRFMIGDIQGMKPYVRGGIAKQVKVPKPVRFSSLAHQMLRPTILTADFAKMEAPIQLHIAMWALDRFSASHDGSVPRPWSSEDAVSFITLCHQIKQEMAKEGNPDAATLTLDTELLTKFAHTASGEMCMITAAIGGMVAQEVLKAVTGKFLPLNQFLYLDALEVVPSPAQMTAGTVEQYLPCDNKRMNPLRICVGGEVCDRLASLRVFMIGAGAIGCEMLKNMALMGISCAGKNQIEEGSASPGKRKREEDDRDAPSIFVTDNDIIEQSNLNRQFLFRSADIRKPKSVVAAAATAEINPAVSIVPQQHRVGPETEDVYSDEFLGTIDIVVNALDNVTARRYMDTRCVATRRPMLDSGTLGTKGHVQVVLPFQTESYSSQADPVEQEVPYCTLRSFPSVIDHCIEWARDRFESLFVNKPKTLARFLQDHATNLVEHVQEASDSELNEMRVPWRALAKMDRMKTIDDCIQRARLKFQKMYHNDIVQLLFAFPLDMKLQDGSPYWTLPKRPPHPILFDLDDPVHEAFVFHTASLFAQIHRIPMPGSWTSSPKEAIRKALEGLAIPEYVPDPKRRIVDDETVKAGSAETDTEDAEAKKTVSRASFVQLCQQYLERKGDKPVQDLVQGEAFEKDDDSNHHIDFMSACANLRARNYGIMEVDRLKVKLVAGKIVPAIATSTSTVSGLVALELLKIVAKEQRLRSDDAMYSQVAPLAKNCFLNLALPFFSFSEPAPAAKTDVTDGLAITLWDRWDVHLGPKATMQQFVDHIKAQYNLGIVSVFEGIRTIYVPLFPGHSKRLKKKMKSLLLKKDRDPSEGVPNYLDLTVTFEDLDTNQDVDGPVVRYFFG